MGSEHSKPVAVVELLSQNNPIYNVPALKEMLKSGSAENDTKVFVICISGVYRAGKSFLLNLLKVYLDHYCKHGSDDGWIGNGDVEIRGGNWAQGEQTVTHGILMYMYPHLINNKAVILMDCQGTKDVMKSSATLDNQIMFLALQLSDVHILNIERSLTADDLDRLELCIYHADDDSTEKLFRRQLFLIRNWGNIEKPQQLDSVIEGADSHAMKKTARGIKRAFESVDIESLPHPGPGIDGKSETSDVHMRDVGGRFLQGACVLFRRLIQQFSPDAKRNILQFIDLFEHASSRAVEKISTPLEAYDESVIQGLYRQLMETVNAKIKELETEVKTGQLSVDIVEERVAEIFNEVNGNFMSHQRVKLCTNSRVINDHQQLLAKSQEEIHTSLVNSCTTAKLSHEVEYLKMSKKEADEKINSLKDEVEKRITEIERERKNESESYNAQLQDTERENAKRLDAMREAHKQELKTTAESGEARAQLERDLQQRHWSQMEKVRTENEAKLQELRLDWDAKEEKWSKEKSALSQEFKAFKKKVKKDKEDVDAKFNKKMNKCQVS